MIMIFGYKYYDCLWIWHADFFHDMWVHSRRYRRIEASKFGFELPCGKSTIFNRKITIFNGKDPLFQWSFSIVFSMFETTNQSWMFMGSIIRIYMILYLLTT